MRKKRCEVEKDRQDEAKIDKERVNTGAGGQAGKEGTDKRVNLMKRQARGVGGGSVGGGGRGKDREVGLQRRNWRGKRKEGLQAVEEEKNGVET